MKAITEDVTCYNTLKNTHFQHKCKEEKHINIC